MAAEKSDSVVFGPYRLDRRIGVLWKDGAPVALTPKASELLLLLVDRGQAGITKAELLEALWPDTTVLENNLTVTMSALRKALAESAASPRYIQTLPRRGYRFVLSALDAPPASEPRPTLPPPMLGANAAAPFVGREAELAFLESRLEMAANGTGQVVFVTGEPGMGKSRLAERFLSGAAMRTHAPLVAIGHSVERFGPGEAYWPFLEAIEQLLRGPARADARSILRRVAPTWCLQFPSLFGDGATDGDVNRELARQTLGATRERMLRETIDAFAALARERPLVLLLEDLHWADASTVDLLRLMCRRSSEHPWLILGTLRTVEAALSNPPLQSLRLELASRHQRELGLEPLAEGQVQSYLVARLGAPSFPSELAEGLLTKTDGQPLFLTRVLDLLVEGGHLQQSEEGWRLTRPWQDVARLVPDDVRGTIQRQFDVLDAEARRALSFASVQGEEFTSVVLSELLETTALDTEERLEPLCRTHHLIQVLGEEELPDGHVSMRYRFAHALYHDVLYDSLVTRRRAVLHLRVAQALVAHYGEQAGRVALPLSIHFERGGDIDRAIEFTCVAASNAHKRLAHVEAKALWTHALALLDERHRSKALTSAEAETQEPALSVQRATLAARMCISRGWVDFDAGGQDSGLADFARAREHARTAVSRDLECEALFASAVVATLEVRTPRSRELESELLDVARAGGDPRWIAQALLTFAWGESCGGRLAEAFRLNREAEALLDPGFPPNVWGCFYDNVGHYLLLSSEYAKALDCYERALELWLDISGVVSVNCYQYLARVRGNLGLISAALASYEAAATLARQNGQEFRWIRYPSGVGWLLREVGAWEQAIETDRAAVARARRHGSRFSELSHAVDLGQTYVDAGQLEAARGALDAARALSRTGDVSALPEQLFGVELRMMVAQAALLERLGRLGEAEQCAERLLEAVDFGREQRRKYAALAHWQLARLARVNGRAADARRAIGAALELLDSYPVPIVTWKVHAEHAQLEASLGNTATASAARDRADQLVRFIGSEINDPALRELFFASAKATLNLPNAR